MDGETADPTASVLSSDPLPLLVDGVEVVSFNSVLARLASEYPQMSVTRIESVLLRE